MVGVGASQGVGELVFGHVFGAVDVLGQGNVAQFRFAEQAQVIGGEVEEKASKRSCRAGRSRATAAGTMAI